MKTVIKLFVGTTHLDSGAKMENFVFGKLRRNTGGQSHSWQGCLDIRNLTLCMKHLKVT